MDEVQLKAFMEGPVPDNSQCRGVALRDLRPGECDHQMGYGGPGESTYCGAPKAEGFSLCEFHLFDTLATFGTPVDHLRE